MSRPPTAIEKRHHVRTSSHAPDREGLAGVAGLPVTSPKVVGLGVGVALAGAGIALIGLLVVLLWLSP